MEDVVFRRLGYGDIDRFIELRKEQLLEEGAEAATDITAALLDFYTRHLTAETFVSWVVVVNGEIIATSGISFAEKPPYYGNPTGRIGILSSMYTVPSYRRKGIAKKLLEMAVNEAKKRGCAEIHITASDMGVPLYEDFGFKRNDKFFQYKIS